MFSGRYEYAIDDKGRLSIPAKFRDILESHYNQKLILTNHFDGCVVGYPIKEWEELQDRIEKSDSALKKGAKNALRFFYGGAAECDIDRLGRVLVPQTLRNFGGIRKGVVIVGMNKKIEIWAEEMWAELVRQTTSDAEKLADIAAELGI